jgi:predicted RNase H-like HicB family nuclease
MRLLKIFRRRGATPEQLVLRVDIERENDQRWIVDVIDLPGVMCYGGSKQEAIDKAAILALRVIAERLENGEPLPRFEHASVPMSVRFQPA